jgi:branched-chain amino acid aminotransferase
MIWRFQPDGQDYLEPFRTAKEADDLDAASAQLPGGAYTTLRTFERTKVLDLAEHLDRLEASAARIGERQSVSRSNLRVAIRNAIGLCAWPETRIRLTLDLEKEPGTIYLSLEQLTPPSAELYRTGVEVMSVGIHRNNPEAKLTEFISVGSQVRKNIPPGIYEAVMLDENGQCLEGTSSNFYVVKNGKIWTAGSGVLPGITRNLVLDEATCASIPIEMRGWPIKRMGEVDEAFLTSASRAVLPVVKMDGIPIGNGEPGPLSQRLLALYNKRIAREIEEI